MFSFDFVKNVYHFFLIAVLISVSMHTVLCVLVSNYSLQFQIVSICVRMYHLPFLFLKVIVSMYMLTCFVFKMLSAVTNR